MDSKKIRYLAGFAFALNALLSFSTNTFETFIGILVWVAPLLMAIALFADIPYLVAAGAGIAILRNLYSFIRALPYVSSDIAGMVLKNLLTALAYGFIILLVFNRKNAVKLSWVAAVFFVLGGIIGYSSVWKDIISSDFRDGVRQILMSVQSAFFYNAIPSILFAFVVQNAPEKQSNKVASTVKSTSTITPGSLNNSVVSSGDRMDYCPKCGASLPPAAMHCPQCGNALVSDPPIQYSTGGMLAWSIVTLLLCTIPGIVALVKTNGINKCTTRAEQEKMISSAKTWNIVGTVLGGLFLLATLANMG